jgi:hypothetical protein
MEIYSFAEIFTAVIMVVGGQQGFAAYRRKKFLNGHPGSDRRRDTMSGADKEFIKTCFDSLGLQLERDLLLQTKEITQTVRDEGASTRIAVRDRN